MASGGISSDEGEIVERTTLPRSYRNGEVDRAGRHRATSSRTPNGDLPTRHSVDRSYSRSRSPRGHKRPHDDRQYRANYEQSGRDDRRRGRDLDRPPSRGSSQYHSADDRSSYRYNGDSQSSRHYGYRHDDRRRGNDHDRYDDGYTAKRPRNRSRSPGSRGDWDRRDRGRFGRENKYSAHVQENGKEGTMSKRATPVTNSDRRMHNAKHVQGVAFERSISNVKLSQPPSVGPEPDLDWDPSAANQKVSEEEEIERRRRAREAAYKRGLVAVAPGIQALQVGDGASSTPNSTRQNSPGPQRTEVNTPQSIHPSTPASQTSPGKEAMSPASFNIADDMDIIKASGDKIATDENGPSAADYDPTVDMKEDEHRDEMRFGNVGLHGERREDLQKNESRPMDEKAGKPKNADPDDVDDFDMFADDFDEEKFAAVANNAAQVHGINAQLNGGRAGILDEDDQDGYYKIRAGEILDGCYKISETLGRGMYSGVARAVEIKTGKVVAVKIMRNNDALRKGGFTEIAILRKLNLADPEDKKHIVRFERSFECKGHLCMAFESLSLNLRELVKKYGKDVGISLYGTRSYAYQMFQALLHMRNCEIIHADLKPDNILVNDNRKLLKICDLGTAIDRSDAATASNDVTPYLVSRFYRAPEIILGIPYDYAVDMWSIGCTLYELFTGKILFTGDSNNQMLKNIQEIRGKLNAKLYRRGQCWPDHFDELGNFISFERDRHNDKKVLRKTISTFTQGNKLRDRIITAGPVSKDIKDPTQYSKDLNNFINLLERCLTLNPDKRITPSEALGHELFRQAPPHR
ncbi:kinase-like domain-containing protein [Apodospora peruviana]|uniref:non-specific serine/threonine protein kinase n=1 Tax=Apodospora peruviana TaxID=516989 RepID=A0AAE0I426_9PEZI|nr:kinase-like domain-containing protein [Apodospora peruviana]